MSYVSILFFGEGSTFSSLTAQSGHDFESNFFFQSIDMAVVTKSTSI